MKKVLFMSTFLMIYFISSSLAQEIVSIDKSGMNIQYLLDHEVLKIRMKAPTNGWVAIGLNSENKLAGSSFLIGRVVNGKAEVIDFYTRKAGDVPKVEDLGGISAVSNVQGIEDYQFTEISFDLARYPKSKFHHQIKKGKRYYMHIAYSQD
ncbi:MAG: DOMON domain-containing protein, partial [Bacteroidota bacterium]